MCKRTPLTTCRLEERLSLRDGRLLIAAAALLLACGVNSPLLATTWSASENSSLFGTLNQHWLDSFYPDFGTGNNNEACSPASMTNSLVYLQNAYPGTYGSSLIATAPANINYNGQSGTTADNWIYTAGGLLASSTCMNTTVANGTTDYNFMTAAYNYIEALGPLNTTYSAMDDDQGWVPSCSIAAPPYLGVQQGQYPTPVPVQRIKCGRSRCKSSCRPRIQHQGLLDIP